MDRKEVVKFWFTSSADDLDTAKKLFETQKYHYALYFCQMAIEKQIKGLIVEKSDQHATRTHDLITLAEQLGLNLSPNHLEQFRTITQFNLNARYDTYKRNFYHKATKSYATQWLKITKDILLWLKKQ